MKSFKSVKMIPADQNLTLSSTFPLRETWLDHSTGYRHRKVKAYTPYIQFPLFRSPFEFMCILYMFQLLKPQLFIC